MRIVLKLAFFCVFLMAIGLIITSVSYAKIDPEALAAMWLFDEKGNQGKDYSGNGHDGQVLGAVKQVKGKFGDAVEFIGGDSITVPDDEKLNFGVKSFTVVVWLSFSTAQDWNRLVRERNPSPWGSGNYGWELQTEGVQIHWSLDDKAGNHQRTTYPDAGNGEWRHTAMIVNREKKMLVSYLDGGDEKTTNIAAIGSVTGELPIVIGGGFIGSIDEVGIFNGILDLDDVTIIMNKGLSETVKKGAAVYTEDKLAATWGRMKEAR